jgi:hypothetical protein
MTMGSFVKIFPRRPSGNFFLFIALAVATGLSGCATLSHYEQSLAPSHPVAVPPPSPSALSAAEARGYQDGLQAGKRLQARRDHAITQAAQDKAATEEAAMEQEAVVETQDMQTLKKVCVGPQPTAKPALTPAPADAAATKPTPPVLFAPSGPARPLSDSQNPF